MAHRLAASASSLLVLLAAAFIHGAGAQLSDAPLRLPGRPHSAVVRPSAAAGTASTPGPEERAGYFAITGTQRRLFYWYFQARNLTTGAALASAPVVVWLNGGPGCSSLFGLFFENGPYTINATQQLVANPFSWAGTAHMLYIDQPIGTGLSYSGEPGDRMASQLDVARTLTAFLTAFYKAPQYSHLSRSRLILSGESFAGHYLPAAAAFIKHHAPGLPLAGVAMGNPFTHAPSMYESYARVALQRGLVPQALFNSVSERLGACKLQSALCSTMDPGTCGAASDTCEYQVFGALIRGEGSQLAAKNLYNLKQTDCVIPSKCYAELDARLEQYINANRAELGAPANLTFATCTDPAFWSLWPDMTRSYDDLIAALLDNGVSVLVYNGDYDFVCTSQGNQKWVDALIWSKQAQWASARARTWAGGTFKRVGPLAFVRFARAGHMVPMDQPALSLALMQQWLARGQPAGAPVAGQA